jgi:hypothetical protein
MVGDFIKIKDTESANSRFIGKIGTIKRINDPPQYQWATQTVQVIMDFDSKEYTAPISLLELERQREPDWEV